MTLRRDQDLHPCCANVRYLKTLTLELLKNLHLPCMRMFQQHNTSPAKHFMQILDPRIYGKCYRKYVINCVHVVYDLIYMSCTSWDFVQVITFVQNVVQVITSMTELYKL